MIADTGTNQQSIYSEVREVTKEVSLTSTIFVAAQGRV
jgi:hypothetical protein